VTAVFLGQPGVGNLRGDQSFPAAARTAVADEQLRRNIGHATGTIRAKRLAAIAECDDWEQLRAAGSALKQDVLARLPELLEQLEANVTARGGTVHWARDGDEANRIVAQLVRNTGSTEVVKVKSMATQETGLNEYLEGAGITPIETDLAELIVQLGHDKPSHILVPAIHRNRTEIRDIFEREMPGAGDLTDEPRVLAMAARAHLRRKFLSARVAVSGANFGVAETGALAVVESEGNGRMCLTLPETLITVMGIEKVIPRFTDLEVFMQLLPRSSTAERMNPYTSMWTGVHPGDGPQQFHLVLLDNGRTRALADEVGRAALHCIRCSACLNVCPVYERTGGHAYGSVYPGPIGAILSPLLTGTTGHDDPNASLPYASSLCGACFEACPVRIDIPSILVHLRAAQVDQERGGLPSGQDLAMKTAGWAMGSAARFRLAEKALGVGRLLAGNDHRISRLPWPASKWTASRDVPAPPAQTFRQWWARNRGGTQ
jgi:L-lactate dehydrogenase complex protein LldF